MMVAQNLLPKNVPGPGKVNSASIVALDYAVNILAPNNCWRKPPCSTSAASPTLPTLHRHNLEQVTPWCRDQIACLDVFDQCLLNAQCLSNACLDVIDQTACLDA